jgi:dTDP-4-amino-4,6-dideoxygalactose transaminase
VLGGSGPPSRLFPETDVGFYSSGRQALVALTRALGLVTGDVVLLPGLVPEGVYAPFVRAGVSVQLYPVDENLDPVWDRLDALMSAGSVRLAVLIHYFGLVKPAERFLDVCRRHDVLMIEDLAHVHSLPDQTIGASGDFVLYSFPKIVGVPDGAAIVVRTSVVDVRRLPVVRDLRRELYVGGQMLNLLLTTLSRRVPSSRLARGVRVAAAYAASSYRVLMSFYHRPTEMSGLSRRMLRRVPWAEVVRHRRELEAVYDRQLNSATFRRFSQHGIGTHASMGFAVRVSNRASLTTFLSERAMHGVYFEHKWNYFTDAPEHDDGRMVMSDHFLFPTAYSLRLEEAESVARAANEWASRQSVRAGESTA